MRFNSAELADFAAPAGEHEGRLTHKPPPRTLYDAAYKERWFKLQANCLFYYRLNEHGGIEKNEPTGVFILENCEVRREVASEVPFGFAIQWKDDPEKKHMFFAQSEQSVLTWMNKIVQASYEHLRAKMIMLRVQIRRKTGKDPLEHLGTTPLPQRASWSQDYSLNSFHELQISHLTPPRSSSAPPLDCKDVDSASKAKYSIPSKSPRLFKRSPKPPPRKAKQANGAASNSSPFPHVGQNMASFKSHIYPGKSEPPDKSTSKSHYLPSRSPSTKSTFKSHIND